MGLPPAWPTGGLGEGCNNNRALTGPTPQGKMCQQPSTGQSLFSSELCYCLLKNFLAALSRSLFLSEKPLCVVLPFSPQKATSSPPLL